VVGIKDTTALWVCTFHPTLLRRGIAAIYHRSLVRHDPSISFCSLFVQEKTSSLFCPNEFFAVQRCLNKDITDRNNGNNSLFYRPTIYERVQQNKGRTRRRSLYTIRSGSFATGTEWVRRDRSQVRSQSGISMR
jgi:hypothetical protein